MVWNEKAFKAWSACENDYTNAIVELRRLDCASEDPKEISSFKEERDKAIEGYNDAVGIVNRDHDQISAQNKALVAEHEKIGQDTARTVTRACDCE
jgi:hypothetical protein